MLFNGALSASKSFNGSLQMFNGVLSANQAFNGALSAGDAV